MLHLGQNIVSMSELDIHLLYKAALVDISHTHVSVQDMLV